LPFSPRLTVNYSRHYDILNIGVITLNWVAESRQKGASAAAFGDSILAIASSIDTSE
jgi:hypothetical protein